MNNLRRDIHSAFEVIEPPLGGMPERVVQTVLAEKNGRLRKEKMVYRLRISLALVAAVLAVAVGVSAVITWNSLHNNVSPVGANPQSTLSQLERHSLRLPTLGPNDPCPHTGISNPDHQFGDGPVFADGGGGPTTHWGNYFDVPYYTAPGLRGLVLIRARDLRSSTIRVVFVGKYAAGSVVGNDPDLKDGAQRDEALLDASSPPSRSPQHEGAFTVRQGLPVNASSCFGFQIDGQDFTETFTGGS